MNEDVVFRLLKLLPSQEAAAIDVIMVIQKYFEHAEGQKPTAAERRLVQRGMRYLSKTRVPPLVNRVESAPPRYYHHASELAQLFITEELALRMLLTRKVFDANFNSFNAGKDGDVQEASKRVTKGSRHFRQIVDHVRLVSDGLGRLPATIAPEVLATVRTALETARQLRFTYCNSKGMQSSPQVTVQGLVAKDGSMYLITTTGLSDLPRHYALHRVSVATVTHKPAQHRPDFQLDEYINQSHQLSHLLRGEHDSTIELKLRVAPQTIFHFKERPLSMNQVISDAGTHDGWYLVTARIAHTYLLGPFLWSMGRGIKVVAPEQVRSSVAAELMAAARHYE